MQTVGYPGRSASSNGTTIANLAVYNKTVLLKDTTSGRPRTSFNRLFWQLHKAHVHEHLPVTDV